MSSNDDLVKLRHSCAHLLAAAVVDIWPDAKPTLGPPIDNGFYYDFDLKQHISEADFPKIEKKMKEIVQSWKSFEKIVVKIEEAQKLFKENVYKTELIKEKASEGQEITFYKSGNFVDLCAGGHIDNPSSLLKYFKLLSVAGAYWRGNEKNKMLTRIYGTCFFSKEDLDKYIKLSEEASKRDHKKLGKALDIFHFSSLVGSGLPLWSPKGTIIKNLLDDYLWSLRKIRGFQKVTIPHITKKDLYVISGHWSKFKDELFRIKSREGHTFALKPMNCPHHTQIFASRQRSYKDMPQRYSETTTCYRDEQSGELSGLLRTRSFIQDDAHTFCRKSQIEEEFIRIWDIVDSFYNPFGFKIDTELSLRDPKTPGAYIGKEDVWNSSEDILRKLAKTRRVNYREAVGEAAFYGPKVDFIAKDSLDRKWQLATIQLDFNMPKRFGLKCINEKGEKEDIVMIHAAIMGSVGRFVAILIEHYSGSFPLWLSPTQVVILPISEKHIGLAEQISTFFQKGKIRVSVDTDNKTISSKIRNHTLQKVPYMCIIGEKEAKKSKIKSVKPSDYAVSIRTREGKNLETQNIDEFITKLLEQIEKKI